MLVGLIAVALAVASGSLAACGGGGDKSGERPASRSGSTASTAARDLVIETRVRLPAEPPGRDEATATGEVLAGSAIGGSDFCSGGTFSDRHGDQENGLADRTFTCADGTLRIGFTPGAPEGRSQSGPWEVISGTGVFERLHGSGRVAIEYEDESLTQGHETFTGTVTP